MIKDRTTLFAGRVVIALAEGELYELGNDPQRRDMVKFFEPQGYDPIPAIKRAAKFWKKHSSSGYEYTRNIYKV